MLRKFFVIWICLSIGLVFCLGCRPTPGGGSNDTLTSEAPEIEASVVGTPDTAGTPHGLVTGESKSHSQLTGDWPQWGGNSARNNTPVGTNIPVNWDVGSFGRTGEWFPEDARNIKWVAAVGSQTYGNPTVADGRIYVGTNNGAGYLQRYPNEIDLGCMIAFSIEDGRFLWQHSNEKLITGRVHDWPAQGICCAPLIEGERCWYVSSRGEVVCLDTQGYYDGEDDGPEKAGLARLFKEDPNITSSLAMGRISTALHLLIGSSGVPFGKRVKVEPVDDVPEDSATEWILTVRDAEGKPKYHLNTADDKIVLRKYSEDNQAATGDTLLEEASDLTAGVADGDLPTALISLLTSRGVELTKDTIDEVTTATPGRAWSIQAHVGGKPRKLVVRREGPKLSAYKQVTVDDTREADEIWKFDMMTKLKVSQHNMCACSVTAYGDILFVNTSNGVDESHINIPSPDAPSFVAMDKNTGEVLWTDASPGLNILHGQWSSPAVGELGGVVQVIFAGGDGWVYSFAANKGQDGKPELLWKFDANPKMSEWILGGRGTRNNIIATPVLYNQRVYVAVGQDPEHGPGEGHLWCIDPTKRGDISPQLAVRVDDRSKSIPHRRIKAVNEANGEVAIDNANSGVIWHYDQQDLDGDGKIAFEEVMHRSCGTVAIKDGLLYISDFSGIFHCLDADTGKAHWTYDMLAAAWGSPLIVDGKVYIGDEDGEVAVFTNSAQPQEPLAEVSMMNSVYSTPIISHNVMYIANRTHLFAIQKESE